MIKTIWYKKRIKSVKCYTVYKGNAASKNMALLEHSFVEKTTTGKKTWY